MQTEPKSISEEEVRGRKQSETNKMIDSGVGIDSDSYSGSYENGFSKIRTGPYLDEFSRNSVELWTTLVTPCRFTKWSPIFG